uniref:Uncharacterized protein LOC111102389 isoform X2 n=1 Tax=Crassostrea virginica TaxID=6565 RepID=A0A8B8AJQ7_CRAVI|nr:uncharacterized protein LOC111102389 isoform X2 [Crassostrea virginica]
MGKQSTQQKKLESLKSLIFNNAKATVTLNSTDLKQLLSLSTPTLGKANTAYSGRKIGFYVTLKSDMNYGKLQTVKFDNIFVNDENDSTCVFTCPAAGTYMFVVDVLLNKHTQLSLRLNKTSVARLYRDSSYSPHVQVSKTILLKLKQGDHVNVVSEYNNVFINGYLYSGFTGTFLY